MAGLIVLFAVRDDPVLSPDSITYLSAAEHLRSLDGMTDFTGEPLAHFPPVLPLLLAPGGRGLVWASIVGAVAAALVAALLFDVLASRVRTSIAVGATLAFALSQATVRTATTVWSETPYLAFALGTLAVLRRGPPTARRAFAGGVLAALACLTRYAGVGLVLTGVVMVVVAAWASPRHVIRRCVAAYLAPPVVLVSAWMARNLVATGEPLGPHFEGGAADSLSLLARLNARSLGRLVLDLDTVGGWTRPVGFAVLAGLGGAIAVVFARRRHDPVDVAMAVFALTSVLVPTASRVVTGTHIEARIMFPVLVPVLYFAAAGVDVLASRTGDLRIVGGVGAALAAVSCGAGVVAAVDMPDRLALSAARTAQPIEELYAAIDDPERSHVLTNSPHRVWWRTSQVPTWFAFTQPEPGNSHFPLTVAETVERACTADTYLAWFPGLTNAQGLLPDELRPDLAAVVELSAVLAVDGGTLYRVEPRDQGSCR